MNLCAFLFIGIFAVLNFLEYAKLVLQELELSSHKFPSTSEECASDIEAYWFSEYPKHCIPPPTDHGAYFVPTGSAPPALCLVANNLTQRFKIKTSNGEHSCSYL